MSKSRQLGGRYAEWTNGTYKVRGASSPVEEPKVITAPLPKYQSTLVGVAPSPIAPPPSSPESVAPPPSSGGEAGAHAESRTAKKAVPIRRDPVFDHLLNALDYERPYVPEQKNETNGEPSVAYSAGPRALATGVDTPPLEPQIKLSDSLVLDLEPKPLAPPPPADQSGRVVAEPSTPTKRNDVPTVIARRVPETAPDTADAGLPHGVRGSVLVGAAFSLLFGAVVLVLVLMRHKTPVANAPPSEAQPRPTAVSEVSPASPRPVAEESKTSLTAAVTTASAAPTQALPPTPETVTPPLSTGVPTTRGGTNARPNLPTRPAQPASSAGKTPLAGDVNTDHDFQMQIGK